MNKITRSWYTITKQDLANKLGIIEEIEDIEITKDNKVSIITRVIKDEFLII